MGKSGESQHSYFSMTQAESGARYRSRSEEIVAAVLESAGHEFIYENPTVVAQRSKRGALEERTWLPDFTLTDSDAIVEYCGFPTDVDYMHGIARKVETYGKMGKTVVLLFPEDVWEQPLGESYRVRDDVHEHITKKLADELRAKRFGYALTT